MNKVVGKRKNKIDKRNIKEMRGILAGANTKNIRDRSERTSTLSQSLPSQRKLTIVR